MIPLKDNQDVASFLVTKHSWRGKYKRVFSIGTHGITTYNPDCLEVTNKWLYADVVTIASAKHSNSTANHDFTLVMKKEKKVDSMKFSSEHKCLILTEAFKYRHAFAEKPKDIYRYQAYKHHWSGTRLPVVLEVGPCALEQLDPSTHTLLASYPYCDMQGILPVRDVPGGFVLAVGGYSRLHLFSNAMDHQIIINKMLEMASLTLSISIKVLSTMITLDDYHDQRFGKYSGDQHQTSLSEFIVHKVVCLRPLSDVFALVRDTEHPQKFSIEYLNGQTRTYLAGERDALLASLLDGVRSAGQRDVHVRSVPTPRGYRLGPLHQPVDEETESNHLRLFQNPVGMSRAEVIERFNANVGYSGLIYSVSQDYNGHMLIKDTCFLSFVYCFREWIGTATVAALRRGSAACAHAALDAVCALLQPMHAEPDLRQEQLNKASMLSSSTFLEGLLTMWADHVTGGSGALVVAAMLDFLTFALCVPYSETTDGKQFDQLLEMVSKRGRVLFKLFEHPSMAIVKGAGLVMRALVEEGSAAVGGRMQGLALAEAALPRHLLAALYAPPRLQHRHLARHLVALWLVDHAPAHCLMRRIMPSGLLAFLESPDAPPAVAESDVEPERDNLSLAQASVKPRAQHWEALERQVKYVEKHLEHYAQLALQHWAARLGRPATERRDAARERPVVLRRRRERVKSTANWPLFYYQFHKDHALPNLIWNHTTREELRNALENELRAFTSDREVAGTTLTSWNHAELEVHYQCLQNEVKIGDYYLRILLEQRDNDDSPIRKSYEFFNDLYHRFLSTPKIEMKCMCLQAMSIVYGRYYEDIGPFADTKYITCDRMERDRLVQFLSKLILHRRNVSDILEWNGVRILVELMTLAHLHTSRATVPTQSNVIEGPQQQTGGDREWYYNVDQGDKVQRKGPVSFQQLKDLYKSGEINNKTKAWANSMEGWRAVGGVAQLKWTLAARGTAVYDESALAATNYTSKMFNLSVYFRDEEDAVIRPLPKVKRMLSEPACLAHVVQLLLTFDPILVEKSSSDIMQRSILGQLLPEAMVCYLENHGAEKFAQIFLGEWDTPEAIWNSEMRFVVGLLKDVLEAWRREVEKKPPSMTAGEAYAALGLTTGQHDEAAVRKAYYRLAQQYHPDKNPEGRDRFEAVNQAYEFLCSRNVWTGDGPNTNNIVLILRTQTILFQRYSEVIKKRVGFVQYVFGYKARVGCKMIEFNYRHRRMLIMIVNSLLRTARLEAEAEQLFAERDSAPLLPAACELAHATVRCSALNAEELRREGGLQVLHEAMSRCVPVLSSARGPTDISAQVCAHAARCFAVAAAFPACRALCAEMPQLCVDLVPLLKRPEIANQLAKQCVVALAAMYGPHTTPSPLDENIQNSLHLLLTPYLCGRLAEPDQHELLKTLTSNWRTPYLVWDNSTRAELKDVLRKSRPLMEDEGPIIEPFTYSAHEGLVSVGGVYIDIYNEQPDFPIENPQQFILELLKFIQEETQNDMTPERVQQVTYALTALANVIIKNPGTEIQCIGQFGLIFGLLSARAHPQLQEGALRVVGSAGARRECVEDVAASAVLGHLLALLAERPPRPATLTALAALLANTAIVREALNKGAVIYLLDLFCNSKLPETREAAVELLARMMADKLHGPKFSRHQSDQLRSPNATFEDRETLERAASGEQAWAPPGEVVVDGVYLKLYLQNPHWNLRSPKRFLQELLTETIAAVNKDASEGGRGETCALALCAALRARPALGEVCAQLGEVPRLARLLPRAPRLAAPLLAALAPTQVLYSYCAGRGVRPAGGGAAPGAPAAARAPPRRAATRRARAHTGARATGELLSLLESRLDGATAAQLVRALKAMARSALHGERVRALLARSAVWEHYSAQRHDLFITAAPQNNLLTEHRASSAGAPHTAGYLTAPPSSIPAQPPPID
ncbi:hypothetical protein HF086_002412 [Spodoptera exigua]|uniref:J domain-containing protein n=1 Tax=Spodoptera exigua TaxID=7107 RepID=A0A922SEY8_SPOEX|nr:hypothetical protein HF086_002412 [Spodoptera exigua]